MKTPLLLGISMLVATGCSPDLNAPDSFDEASLQKARACLEQVKITTARLEKDGLHISPPSATNHEEEIKTASHARYNWLTTAERVLSNPNINISTEHERMEYAFVLRDKSCNGGPIQDYNPDYHFRYAAEDLRTKALNEWDNEIRNNIDDRRRKLTKAAISVTTDASGSTRVDSYKMKDGRLILCSTKVLSSGPFMKCDGQP